MSERLDSNKEVRKTIATRFKNNEFLRLQEAAEKDDRTLSNFIHKCVMKELN